MASAKASPRRRIEIPTSRRVDVAAKLTPTARLNHGFEDTKGGGIPIQGIHEAHHLDMRCFFVSPQGLVLFSKKLERLANCCPEFRRAAGGKANSGRRSVSRSYIAQPVFLPGRLTLHHVSKDEFEMGLEGSLFLSCQDSTDDASGFILDALRENRAFCRPATATSGNCDQMIFLHHTTRFHRLPRFKPAHAALHITSWNLFGVIRIAHFRSIACSARV